MQKYKYVRNTQHNYDILKDFPNAGPRPNIAGMRKLYWGKDALLIKCGQYVYKVNYETFTRL